jgi:hypothetical protein
VSVHRKGDRWVVRWRAGDRQRSHSFRTKQEAAAFDRQRQRDEWRGSIAMPEKAVTTAAANSGTSFIVCESLEGGVPGAIHERPIHEGFFRTIRQADRYRQQMPDADVLDIVFVEDRYPLRNLTDAEIAAGRIDQSKNAGIRDLLEQIRAGQAH